MEDQKGVKKEELVETTKEIKETDVVAEDISEKVKEVPTVTFPQPVINEILSYLSTKPYSEVTNLINLIQTTAQLK